MRLLHTERLQLEEFYDSQIPLYAILSHRWNSVDQEVSYVEFKAGDKRRTSGYDKILKFCSLARRRGFKFCWIDTCCIDKSSSAELTEAINSMYVWYQRAARCFVYLQDISDVSNLSRSEWFSRGWTLQELIAPQDVEFFSKDWRPIGSKIELREPISEATGINKLLLSSNKDLYRYSVAEKMSWAARRRTSRIEDEAYCLMGLFSVNMPLLYGEGILAFRRLQEEILINSGDDSIFAWGSIPSSAPTSYYLHPSMLAYSPRAFVGCAGIKRKPPNAKILFETTNQGMMILIHRSQHRETLDKVVKLDHKDTSAYFVANRKHIGLTVPLSCYREQFSQKTHSFCLRLIVSGGVWYRIGVTSHSDLTDWQDEEFGNVAYDNDYVRLYVWNLKPHQSSNDAGLSIESDVEFLPLSV